MVVLALHLFTTLLQYPSLEDVLWDSQVRESGVGSQYAVGVKRLDGDLITSSDFMGVIEV